MISVIVPIYNVEKYLDKCLQSISEQSYTDWECILVNDGSTDNSGHICNRWSKTDLRFVCIHQQNQGVSTARNIGLKNAHGEYVVFIDSDDFVEPNFLLNLITDINCKDVDIIVSGIVKIHKNNHKEYIIPTCTIIEMANIYCDIFLDNIGLFYGPCSKLYKKEIIDKYSIYFPVDLSLGEDIIFNFTYLNKCNKIKLLNFADYNYRQLDNGLCNKYRPDLFNCLFRIWNFRVDTLIQKGMWNNKTAKYFSIQLWGYTYDCLFSKVPLSYYTIRTILNKIDVRILNDFKKDFLCAKWIKLCILYRFVLPIYLITRKIHKNGLQ